MTTRRTLLAGMAGILSAGYAPASVSSVVLMPVRKITLPTWLALDTGAGDFTVMARRLADGKWHQIIEVHSGAMVTSYIDGKPLPNR